MSDLVSVRLCTEDRRHSTVLVLVEVEATTTQKSNKKQSKRTTKQHKTIRITTSTLSNSFIDQSTQNNIKK